MLKRSEIRIRDPFIYTDVENGFYYMYGTTSVLDGQIAAGTSFAVYKSTDLENFEGPKIIFDGSGENFWADRDFWAAEMHEYKGKYYLFEPNEIIGVLGEEAGKEFNQYLGEQIEDNTKES